MSFNPPVVLIQNTYTAAGALPITDDISFVNVSATTAMTLANDSVDLHVHRIFQAGAGTVNVTANIAGTSQAIPLSSDGTLKSSLTLRWSASSSTYFVE
jgi:hypothetical protein